MSSRRKFMLQASALAAVQAFPRAGHTEESAVIASDLTLEEDTIAPRIPLSYIGLSYEPAQLSDPAFFSPSNRDLVAYFRLLSRQGILQLGGNTSEFCWFRGSASTPVPRLHVPEHPDENWMPHQLFAVTPEAIVALAGFLKATGWRLIYGLNFGNSTPERAGEEAAFVAKTIGDRLEFFQIGNEPDLYAKATNGTRRAGWGFDDYIKEWTAFADAVSARVPGARFGGPDVAASSDWVVRFGGRMAPRLKGRLAALTGHYYAEGPPNDPAVTIARLLAPNPKVAADLRRIEAVARPVGPQYRMTEGNSCYRGGKPGMSDAFAASLWAADYLLELASQGCVGVNLHGGSSALLTAGLGGHTPGMEVAKTPQKVRAGFYSPIRCEPGNETRAMPVFYGMMLAGQLAGGRVVRTKYDLGGANAKVYAVVIDSCFVVAIINKDDTKTVVLTVGVPAPMTKAATWTLEGSRLDATEGVTLAGAEIAPHAQWSHRRQASAPIIAGKVRVRVPSASATLLFLH